LLALRQAHCIETIIADAIDLLAGAATSLWPLWFGGEDFSELNDSALSHQYLPIKLAVLKQRFPSLSIGWAEAAIRQVLRGKVRAYRSLRWKLSGFSSVMPSIRMD
jgi:hypothetical protein